MTHRKTQLVRHIGFVLAALLVVFLLTLAAPPRSLSTPANRANIVFILTDDLSWNLVQYMPNVVRMQQAGVTFTNYIVTDSLCCPSRSSIFTGRFPHNTGVFRNIGPDGGYRAFERRGNQLATFATTLSAAGYRTAMLGKYLNGYEPGRDRPDPGWTFWAVAGEAYKEFNIRPRRRRNDRRAAGGRGRDRRAEQLPTSSSVPTTGTTWASTGSGRER